MYENVGGTLKGVSKYILLRDTANFHIYVHNT